MPPLTKEKLERGGDVPADMPQQLSVDHLGQRNSCRPGQPPLELGSISGLALEELKDTGRCRRERTHDMRIMFGLRAQTNSIVGRLLREFSTFIASCRLLVFCVWPDDLYHPPQSMLNDGTNRQAPLPTFLDIQLG